MSRNECVGLVSSREARRRERDGVIARRFKKLARLHPECAPHRLMAVIAAEMDLTPMGVRVSLLRTGSYVPGRRRTEGGAADGLPAAALESGGKEVGV